MNPIPAQYYSLVYVGVIGFIAFFTAVNMMSSKERISQGKNFVGIFLSLVLASVAVLFFGFRPIGMHMGDTAYYVHSYILREEYSAFSWDENWIWTNLNVYCKEIGLDYAQFFLLVAAVYVGGMLYICFRTTHSKVWLPFIFFAIAFSFYGYGINGIRNGMACSICLIAIASCVNRNWECIIGFVLIGLVYFVHKSTLIPDIALALSLTFVRQPRKALVFWLMSIVLSLIVGNAVGNYIASTGMFDEKSNYFLDAADSEYAYQFSYTGFRWDFLIYSAMPVWLIWYLTVKRSFNDLVFNVIANTYVIANALWIIVIRATFSNRFAYLSWFLYPMVIAYPLVKFKIWEDQNYKSALILLAYTAFTVFMYLH